MGCPRNGSRNEHSKTMKEKDMLGCSNPRAGPKSCTKPTNLFSCESNGNILTERANDSLRKELLFGVGHQNRWCGPKWSLITEVLDMQIPNNSKGTAFVDSNRLLRKIDYNSERRVASF